MKNINVAELKTLVLDYKQKLAAYESVDRLLEVSLQSGAAIDCMQLEEESDTLYDTLWAAYHLLSEKIAETTEMDTCLAHSLVRWNFQRVEKLVNALK